MYFGSLYDLGYDAFCGDDPGPFYAYLDYTSTMDARYRGLSLAAVAQMLAVLLCFRVLRRDVSSHLHTLSVNQRGREGARVGDSAPKALQIPSNTNSTAVCLTPAPAIDTSRKKQRRRPLFKLTLLPWVYAAYSVSVLVMGVSLLLMWSTDPGTEAYTFFMSFYAYALGPANGIEGVCLAIMVYPIGARVRQRRVDRGAV
ncbi:hypothetical protein KIPB_009568 [Kipferlia bialata]|uniref:Uncharacterized protein n=1 Tax=Kipferlia bialata TaxID=797122 RepID=A0A9K3D451_9EUKA|nr:hypothetical protein KIPB_009568 [Kipferlia bialata]|eukprot:g9568.t1